MIFGAILNLSLLKKMALLSGFGRPTKNCPLILLKNASSIEFLKLVEAINNKLGTSLIPPSTASKMLRASFLPCDALSSLFGAKLSISSIAIHAAKWGILFALLQISRRIFSVSPTRLLLTSVEEMAGTTSTSPINLGKFLAISVCALK